MNVKTIHKGGSAKSSDGNHLSEYLSRKNKKNTASTANEKTARKKAVIKNHKTIIGIDKSGGVTFEDAKIDPLKD